MQLVTQFLSETVFITSVATITSVAITPLLLKVFQDFIPPGVHFEVLQQPAMIAFLLLLIATVSFLSGLYPALILSGFNPVAVLKGSTIMQSGSTRKAGVRKTLTVAQFVIAQFFIIATLLVSKQINYSIHSDMGFTTEAIVSFEQPRDTVASHGKRLLSEIIALPGVATASTGFFSPGGNMVAFTNVSYNNGKEELKPNTQIRWGDPNFIKVYDIKLIAGHNVSPSDEIKEFLVNESYAHAIGFPHAEDALNHFLKFNDKNIPIVGIMKDFHDGSTHSAINPLVMGGNNGSIFHIKLKPNNVSGIAWSATLASIQKSFHQFYPEEDFSYSFFDENIAKMYQTELETAGLLKWATALTVFISCLGLLGLVIYTTNTRTKEIGVRKILGASVSNIVTILSKDFVQLVLIAFVIAAPLGWWAMYTWLQSFVYKTSMSWWIFVISGAGMLLIALITLSVQTIKTATANPVKSLRTE